jgi:hypothetical protein
MTNRAIFNRQYTSYTPGGTEVWLVNGTAVTTTPVISQSFTAGENLVQGQAVYVSGTYAFSASAASGVATTQYNVIGFTTTAAALSTAVAVVVDDIAFISSANLAGATQLTPGTYYYLSKYTGQITPYSTTSGTVTASGGYAALVNIGQALSTTELQVEIEPPVVLYD